MLTGRNYCDCPEFQDLPTETSVQRDTMLRFSVTSPTLKMSYKRLGVTRLATPRLKQYKNMTSISVFATYPRSTTKQSEDSTSKESPCPDKPSEAASKRLQDLKSKTTYDWSPRRHCACDANGDEHPIQPIAYQDIRTHGPLFNLSRRELDRDRKTAKQQWHNLCTEFNEKQRVATVLWGEHEALKDRCKRVESCCAALREKVDHLTGIRAQLEADNEILREDLKQTLELAEFFYKTDKMRYGD
ncbi:hypothetical protein RRF57_003145 [Xylaria bambusicola]|uniref:Uncharacterized protein n=1 Tax=Xylaria bambusicola TaxID=326684 RepID=A0AAN7U8A6_9PEZI